MADSKQHTADQFGAALARKCIPEPNSGCLIWLGAASYGTGVRRSLYGSIRRSGKMVKVHRAAYEISCGPIPDGMHVLHKCDVSLCCNPEHLSLGTNDENHADKARRDRGAKKLTAVKASLIRGMALGGVTQTAIAKHFNVQQSTISRIVNGKRRRHASLA